MLYYKATAGCGVGMFVGVSARKRAAPVALILGRVAALPPPSAAFLSPSPPAAHSPVPSVCLAPSSRPPARPPPSGWLPSLPFCGSCGVGSGVVAGNHKGEKQQSVTYN